MHRVWAWRRSKGGNTAGMGEAEHNGVGVGVARKGVGVGMGMADKQGGAGMGVARRNGSGVSGMSAVMGLAEEQGRQHSGHGRGGGRRCGRGCVRGKEGLGRGCGMGVADEQGVGDAAHEGSRGGAGRVTRVTAARAEGGNPGGGTTMRARAWVWRTAAQPRPRVAAVDWMETRGFFLKQI